MTDQDDDGYGAQTPAAGADQGTDCNDAAASINPSQAEIVADGIDQDCDSFDDCYEDLDGDSYGSAQLIDGSLGCNSTNESADSTDCDDDDSAEARAAPSLTSHHGGRRSRVSTSPQR